ncbi:filamentous hemagglutinin N-terminal domain-containing protein [Planktothrix sp. FACHB-1355]|uniref:Filamentous hemagglutinin N-terminal domain-containing protein n=1 Tax=Aerosakkonema funiforme FACHB-1375 TaxID=2949571 RepID=A0A926VFS7_9CYAN|nr:MULTISPECIES: filamentous hemagglutinin N-terminal domain-containing protein [Oscillatoriales]MBD2182878.1 filamentous hemagglutinin N-terminal domain-containing protein [Aerosakkonema funiforme FACHB-1375]MBD3558176.1 filamentous hemagglutinin N-terminal domain-containing protein [Planktothrix sp. FACHB-1355]
MNIYRITCWLGAIGVIFTAPVAAQIAADGSISTSVISADGLNFTIDNGAVEGNNLFHSFREFSIPTNGSAFFNNAANIQNIFSRITGGNISQIDGLIRANGSANLFLLNPAGILFGPNAQLNIGGSFLGTTADTIRFADGVEFSATNPTATPLLTVSIPVGLQMGETPGTITVQNTGHRLNDNILIRLDFKNNPVGLRVSYGNSLILVGGNINLDGGLLTAQSGQIELGSASSRTVNFKLSEKTWSFDYSDIQQFGEIEFSQQALVDASGAPGGSIHLQGRNISLNEGSIVALTNLGNSRSGNITINASESLELRKVGTDGFSNTRVTLDNLGNGAIGDILVSARELFLQDGGAIVSTNFSGEVGGNIYVNTTNFIKIDGFSAINTSLPSGIDSFNFYNVGRGGNVWIETKQLTIQNGGAIPSVAFGFGTGGNIQVNAFDSIELRGENPLNFTPTGIGMTSFRGNTGQLTINTSRLIVIDGANVSAATQSPGNAGNLTIDATSSIEVSGVGAISGQPSKISAGATVLTPTFQQTFGLPPFPTGNTGDLIVNTPQLQISNGGIVSVSHEGVGNAGNLLINANSILLDRAGSITAATNSGEGGSMNLRTNTLIARNGSSVSTTAGGSGNGGNMTIASPIVVGLENSDITANAFQGRGGNIQITTEGIFLSADSNITASSQLGISGNVSISNLNLQPETLVFLPANTLVNQTPVIASSCLTQRNAQQGRFVVTGNGGLSETPDNLAMPYEAAQVRTVGQLQARGNQALEINNSKQPDRSIQEATGLAFTPDGKLILVINQTQPSPVDDLTCSF